jgi:hypothetical protein
MTKLFEQNDSNICNPFYHCPADQTCCHDKFNAKCCPHGDGQCCRYMQTCCPMGTNCDYTGLKCTNMTNNDQVWL